MSEDFSAAERAAMRRALALAATPEVPLGPNPRVGCVLLNSSGTVVAEGFHRGAGTPHAEADALAGAGSAAHGATAVVTLEPCNHTGRTGPCAEALIAAGISRVVFAQADPNPIAAGGADTLIRAGVDVASGLLAKQAQELNRAWLFGLEHQRPLVTWKYASTLDGFSAAADGSSKWITSRAARVDSHVHRGESDVILAGSNTIQVDDPSLTVRDASETPVAVQPLRAVMGLRELPSTSQVFDETAESVVLRTRDPLVALKELFSMGKRHVFLEGGPTVAAAFMKAGVIDEVIAYLAPKMLGSGARLIADIGIENIDEAVDFEIDELTTIGSGREANIKVIMRRSN
jgi:diaminohydroxyphosphoribosylaminopyrimidine deaminase/5-amino-6-(5-phosphoribosylamino)uracil reductase